MGPAQLFEFKNNKINVRPMSLGIVVRPKSPWYGLVARPRCLGHARPRY